MLCSLPKGPHLTKTNFFALCISKSLAAFHGDIDPLFNTATENDILKGLPLISHFPFEVSRLNKFFDPLDVLNHLFDLKICRSTQECRPKEIRMTRTMKEILYASVKLNLRPQN